MPLVKGAKDTMSYCMSSKGVRGIVARLQGEDKPSPLLWTSFARGFSVA
jgi:hypothetical protein